KQQKRRTLFRTPLLLLRGHGEGEAALGAIQSPPPQPPPRGRSPVGGSPP
uniref:Uncharacterized protein n=1 Tax=Aegilops tauschii subsp. strangulata TaxID=200361 RepID=A0A453LAD4_AEGTS